jgi:hypothetical protein
MATRQAVKFRRRILLRSFAALIVAGKFRSSQEVLAPWIKNDCDIVSDASNRMFAESGES